MVCTMLNWRGRDGGRIELAIAGYQFPEAADGHDANWLWVELAAESRFARWSTRSPCILTWELDALLSWMADIETDEAESWCGLEPDLKMTCLGWSHGRAVIAVRLSHGLRDAAHDTEERGACDFVIVEPTADDLATARKTIELAMAAFPARGQLGARCLAGMRSARQARLKRRSEE